MWSVVISLYTGVIDVWRGRMAVRVGHILGSNIEYINIQIIVLFISVVYYILNHNQLTQQLKMPSAKVVAKKKAEEKTKAKLGVKKTVKTKKVSKKVEKKTIAKKIKKTKAPAVSGAKPKSAAKKKVAKGGKKK